MSNGVVCCYARGGRGPTAYTPILQVFPAATISQAGQSDAREVPFGSKDRTYRRYFGTNPNIARATTSGNFFSPAQHQSYHSFSRGRCSGRFFNEAPAGKKHLAGRAGLSANPSKAYFESLIRSHRRLMFYILGRARRVFFLYAGFANPSPLGATLISRSDSTGVRQMGHLLDWCRSIRAHPLHMHM